MRRYLFFLLLIHITQLLTAQNDNAEKFQLALSKYDSEQFDDALKLFRETASSPGRYSSTALLFSGKTELKLNRADDAGRTIIEFLRNYPQSIYRDEARITLAKVYIELEDHQSALREILYLIEDSKSKGNVAFAKDIGTDIASSSLMPADLEMMLPAAPGERSKPFLLLLTGKSYLQNNNKLEADAAFLEILELFPESEEKNEASVLYREKLKQKSVIIHDEELSIPVIAALLPLTKTGSDNEMTSVKEILEGIKYAVSDYNSRREERVGLLIRDTRNSPAEIEELKKELERIPSLKIIIGPVFSDEVRAALRVFKSTNIPVISPTATDDDLAEMNDLFFQANPSFAMRGRAMAQHVFFVDKKRKMGVLNAIEGYSSSEALGFTSEFERLGGEIIVRETYKSGSFELQDQSRRLSSFPELEGLFIPLTDKADAPVIINELMMNNVNLPVYGNQDWFYSKANSNLSGMNEQLTFTSDHFINYNDPGYQQFAKDFNSAASLDANRNVLYGYDAAKFIFESVTDWNMSPLEIGRAFKTGRSVEGYHNDLCFDGQRVNNFLNIIRYRDGIFELVEKYKTAVR